MPAASPDPGAARPPAAGAAPGRPASTAPELGIGLVGYGFMGAAHSSAWRNVARVFDVPLRPRMAALCGRDAPAARAAAQRFGWASAETDWRALITRDDVQLVDICAPGDVHAEIAIAALEAGKHVLCEKPLANTVAEAEAMAEAAERAGRHGVQAMTGFNYRRVPAIALARQLVAAGRLGPLRHVRAAYLQDWLADPAAPMTWRLRRERAGSGALGDIGAHAVDLAQYLTGEPLTGVSGLMTTFVTERPLATAGDTASGPAPGVQYGTVTVDDAALFTGRLASGTLASFEATRSAAGRKNALRVELNGEQGSLAFDLERLNELGFYDRTEASATAGFRRIVVTEPVHPYMDAWWPPGHVIGWEHTFVHQARDLLAAIAAGTAPQPSFADGLQVQRVLAAVAGSAADASRWTEIDKPGE
ncbi:MAG TPA: Gfo/Idh/MocA family oxidoreductase [Streptosporangiaceae bacterium]